MGSEWSDILEPAGSDWSWEIWAIMCGVLACFM